MAFSGIGKLISALTAQTSIADTDCFMVGTNDVKKITWANVVAAIKTKLGGAATKSVANNLTTSTAGSSVLDAYQGKLLKDQLDEQNTNLTLINFTSECQCVGSVAVNSAYKFGKICIITGAIYPDIVTTAGWIAESTHGIKSPYLPVIDVAVIMSRPNGGADASKIVKLSYKQDSFFAGTISEVFTYGQYFQLIYFTN